MLRTFEQPGCFRISTNARVCKSCIESRVFAIPVAALLRSVGDLVFQVAGLMIAAELAQRRLVQLKQNLAQLLGFRIAGCETLSVNLTQRADHGCSVFAADFAILVAVAIVETRLAHAALHCAPPRYHPPAGIKWQLARARNHATGMILLEQ